MLLANMASGSSSNGESGTATSLAIDGNLVGRILKESGTRTPDSHKDRSSKGERATASVKKPTADAAHKNKQGRDKDGESSYRNKNRDSQIAYPSTSRHGSSDSGAAETVAEEPSNAMMMMVRSISTLSEKMNDFLDQSHQDHTDVKQSIADLTHAKGQGRKRAHDTFSIWRRQ